MANEYNSYLHRIKEMFNDDKFYNKCIEAIQEGESSFKITQKYNKKVFDLEWVEVIESTLPSLDTIVRNPRKFITIEEDIIDISLAKNISVESVKHLATHSNLIAAYDKEKDMVTPSKILNTSKEETYEVYENRFIYTLLKKLYDFVNNRYELIKRNVKDESNQIQISVDTSYKYGLSNMQVRLDAISNMPYEEVKSLNSQELTPIERVAKMHNIVSGFLSSAFAKAMVGCAPVRPPITRTNVIKKEPNYKKALVLWQFIESYDKVGFEVQVVNETREMNDGLSEQYKQLMFINNMILENLSNSRTEEGDLDSLQDRAADRVDNSGKSPSSGKYKVVNGVPTGYNSLGGFQDIEFTGDQFPEISLDLKEVRKVYAKKLDDKTFSDIEYREITSALDRVIRQNQINQLKKQDEERKRLEKKQLEEEKKTLAKNLADRKREEARLKREEEAQLRAIKQQELARKRAEKKALQERMEKERLEERKRKEEEAKIALEQKLERERQEAFEAKRQAIIDEIHNKIESEFEKELSKFDLLENDSVKSLRQDLELKAKDIIDRIMVDFVDSLEDKKAEELNTPVDREEVEKQLAIINGISEETNSQAESEEVSEDFQEIKVDEDVKEEENDFDENSSDNLISELEELGIDINGPSDEEIIAKVYPLYHGNQLKGYGDKKVPSFKEQARMKAEEALLNEKIQKQLEKSRKIVSLKAETSEEHNEETKQADEAPVSNLIIEEPIQVEVNDNFTEQEQIDEENTLSSSDDEVVSVEDVVEETPVDDIIVEEEHKEEILIEELQNEKQEIESKENLVESEELESKEDDFEEILLDDLKDN